VKWGLKKVFPDHWSFMLGEVAMYSLIVLLLTGVFLTFWFIPSAGHVVYDGSYVPLKGIEMSEAYKSTLDISFEIRGGLIIRQIHHWSALLFVAAIATHMFRVFFTGAFRKPREINWLVGIGLLIMALAMGITGYSLPDDLLSGTGLRIIYSVILSIPFIGPYLAFLLFGGEFPTATIISRLFVFHIMLLPALLIGGVLTHLAILWRQTHTQFRRPGATEHNVMGRPFWPSQVFKSTGLMILTAAVIALMSGLVQVNPVWTYGPFEPTTVSAPAQPDWYVGWLEGALRLFPSFEVTLLGITIPSPFIPGILIPGVAFGVMTLWPFIEARITGDHAEHNLLDAPREAPLRTSIGVAGLLFFVTLTIAGGNDVIGLIFDIPVESITGLFRIGIFVIPIVGFGVTYRVCRELQARAAAGPRGRKVKLRRSPAGGFEEVDEA